MLDWAVAFEAWLEAQGSSPMPWEARLSMLVGVLLVTAVCLVGAIQGERERREARRQIRKDSQRLGERSLSDKQVR